MKNIKISQLWTYPIKSLPGISITESKLFSKGLEYDRNWMLVDSNNHFISQRKYPVMALISVAIEEYGLKVSFHQMPPLIIPWVCPDVEALEPIKVTVWSDECDALHINTAIDNWFSEVLGDDCQLVYLPDESPRYVDKEYAHDDEQTRFSDGFPLLLISEASLDDLNSRLDSDQEKPLTMKNFRPNIVVSGCASYDEDNWREFSVKQAQFSVVKPCSRCVITTIDPLTGKKSLSREPLKTLSLYRKKDNKVFFGQNVLVKIIQSEILAVGDSLIF
jgi:MOSC domain-containing protein